MRKAFSQGQHDQDDEPTKKAVAKYIFTHWNCSTLKNEDPFGVDIICMRDGEVVGHVEVERRHSWQYGDFPFKTVHIPGRKRKFFEVEIPTVIFSVRKDLQKALWTTGEIVLGSPIVYSDNKDCMNEDFFDVSVDKWRVVDL